MNQNTPEHRAEAELALSHLQKMAKDVDTIDPNLLAAWLDGTIDEQDTPPVEAALAVDADLRRFVVERRLHGALAPEQVPVQTLHRLHAIRQPAAPLAFTGSHRAWWISSAAAIAIAVLGFWTGRLSMLDADRTGSEVLATATFDVFTNEPVGVLDGQFLGLELAEDER